MDKLTIAEMVDRQREANKAADGFRQKAEAEKKKAADLQHQIDDALRAGDEAKFTALLSEADSAGEAAARYQRLADATSRKIFPMNEVEAVWDSEQAAFMNSGEYATAAAAFNAALDNVKTNYKKLFDLIGKVKTSGMTARAVLVDAKTFPFVCQPEVSADDFIAQIRATLDQCRQFE